MCSQHDVGVSMLVNHTNPEKTLEIPMEELNQEDSGHGKTLVIPGKSKQRSLSVWHGRWDNSENEEVLIVLQGPRLRSLALWSCSPEHEDLMPIDRKQKPKKW